MGNLSLTISYGINSDVIFSPSELNALYLYGIDVVSSDGTAFSDESM